MAVTKQTYTATATWTVSTLASIFSDAFIDAGLMTAWHDSFLSGSVENRILAVAYDGTKTYGTTYYWFQFTTTGVFYSNTSGWDAGADQPSGTQYLDYFSLTTNSTGNHVQLLAVATSTTVTLTRYTSGNHSFFVLRSGTAFYTFCIDHAGVTRQSWLDLDRGYHNGMARVTCTSSYSGLVNFESVFRCRRSFLDGGISTGGTSLAINYNDQVTVNSLTFGAFGSNGSSNPPASTEKGLYLPSATSAANGNPALASDFVPVFTGIRVQAGHAALLPSDFGIMGARLSNTWAIQDTVTVTAAVEVYEVIAFANGATVTGAASPLFLARTT